MLENSMAPDCDNDPEGATITALRVVIVGGVAGGMSTATRLRRLDEAATITVIERSGHVSYANCGLPYFVGGVIEDEDDLLLQTPERLFDRFRLDVRVDTEVVEIDAANHTVTTRSTVDGRTQSIAVRQAGVEPRCRSGPPIRYPVSTGSVCFEPSRTPNDSQPTSGRRPGTAVVIGAGFIGLETAENLARQSHRRDRRGGGRTGPDPARPRTCHPGGRRARFPRRCR